MAKVCNGDYRKGYGMSDYRYYDESEKVLLDDDIVEDLHSAAEMVEDGEILEVESLLAEIIESIRAFTDDYDV